MRHTLGRATYTPASQTLSILEDGYTYACGLVIGDAPVEGIASIDSILYTKCQGGDFLARDKGVLPAPQGAVLDWGTDSTFSGGTVSNVRGWRGAKVSA